MKILLEFTKPPTSSAFAWTLRVARTQPGYSMIRSGRLQVHRIAFSDAQLGAFLAIYDKICSWKTVAVYIEGELVARAEAFNRILEHHRIGRTRGHRIYTELLQQIRREGTSL